MPALKEELLAVFNKLRRNKGIYTTIIVSFSYHFIFEEAFTCPDEFVHRPCYEHLILPCFIIWILLLWMDNVFQTACLRCNLLCTGVVRVIHAGCVAAIWMVSVLLDGDWWLCCGQNSCHQMTLEKNVILNCKHQSRGWGLVALLVVVLIASLASCIRACCYRYQVNVDVILEEGQNLVNSLVKQGAKDKLKEDVQACIKRGEWAKCSNAAVELIKQITSDPPQNPPAESPTNRSRPAESPTNRSPPAESPTNRSTPAEGPTNRSRPAESPTNRSTPAESPTNRSPPAEGPTNRSRPAESPTNRSRPADDKSIELKEMPKTTE